MDRITGVDISNVLYSIKLVQPGRLGDVVEGLRRLVPGFHVEEETKRQVNRELRELLDLDLVRMYARTRYMLTRRGEEYIHETGLRRQLEARRLFLLKETRKGMI